MRKIEEIEKKPRTRVGSLLWVLLWSLQITVCPLESLWAQRRPAEAEPEAETTGEAPPDEEGGPTGEATPPAEDPAPVGEDAPVEEGAPAEEEAAPDTGGPISDEDAGAADGPVESDQQEAAPPKDEPPARREAPPRPAPPTNPLDARIVVRVKNAPLSTFLDTISAQAQVNFIITEGLENKRVTAFLQNVSVREALQILLEIKGLTYQRIGRSSTYVVSPREEGAVNRITRIYTLNHISFIPLDAGGKSQAGSKLGAKGAPEGAKKGGGGIGVVNIITSVLTVKYGSIEVDSRTNSVIITDIPEVFPQVEQILAELDKKAPQIMVEAQIVEINSDRAQQLGLEWGGATGQLASFTAGARDMLFPLDIPQAKVSRTRFGLPLNSYTSAVDGTNILVPVLDHTHEPGQVEPPLADMLTGVLDLTSLTIVLRALVTHAEARFLGKPKIMTLNNKPALIQFTRQQGVAIQQEASQTAGAASSGNSVERFSTGLTLKVTPQVNAEGYITMTLEPDFTNVQESKISSADSPVFDPVKRGVKTRVRVKNGHTLVLAGLLQSTESKVVRKVPFLGSIPLIGWLFTTNTNQRSNTDLVIFITPTIIND